MIVFFDFVIIIVIINIITITPLVIIIQPTIKLETGAVASVEFIRNSYSKLLLNNKTNCTSPFSC